MTVIGHKILPIGRILSHKTLIYYTQKVKEKGSRYRPVEAHRVGRGIALLFHDRGTRRG
jgi:hypothetical protein